MTMIKSIFIKSARLTVVLIVLILSICLSTCKDTNKVPVDFIEACLIAYETHQFGWLADNSYWVNNEKPEASNIESYSESDRALLLDMLQDNYSYQSYYNGNKATIVIDFSNSGIFEWKYINKYGIPQGIPVSQGLYEISKHYKLYFQYNNGRWWHVFATAIDNRNWPGPE